MLCDEGQHGRNMVVGNSNTLGSQQRECLEGSGVDLMGEDSPAPRHQLQLNFSQVSPDPLKSGTLCEISQSCNALNRLKNILMKMQPSKINR